MAEGEDGRPGVSHGTGENQERAGGPPHIEGGEAGGVFGPASIDPVSTEDTIDWDKFIGEVYGPEENPNQKHRPDQRSQETIAGSAKSAVTHGVAAADDALIALVKLFGGDTSQVNSGPVFDAETRKRAKPLFISATDKFYRAGMDVRDMRKQLVTRLEQCSATDGFEVGATWFCSKNKGANEGTTEDLIA